MITAGRLMFLFLMLWPNTAKVSAKSIVSAASLSLSSRYVRGNCQAPMMGISLSKMLISTQK